MSDFTLIYSTFASSAQAEQVANSLFQEKLIACANIFPMGKSIYVWDGKLQNEAETYVFFKTTKAVAAKLKARLGELHPYQIPCILELNVTDLNSTYGDWLAGSISGPIPQ